MHSLSAPHEHQHQHSYLLHHTEEKKGIDCLLKMAKPDFFEQNFHAREKSQLHLTALLTYA